jgi:minor extracellular serine protease Vpr
MTMFPRLRHGYTLFALICFVFCAAPAFAQLVANRYTLLLGEPSVASRFETRAEVESAAGIQYRTQIETRQRAVLAELAARNIPVTGRVSTLLNAIFVAAPASRLPEMLAIPGVAAVRPMRRVQLLLNRATQLMNAPVAWTALGGQASAGKGMKIAIIDTGIDQTHPAFQDSSLTPPAGFPICTTGHPEDCGFTNSKVIVARSYVRQIAGFTSKSPATLPDDTSVPPPAATSQPDDYSPSDHVGHGTATASVAAANQNSGIVTFTGMAPKAFLGNYKIFGTPGVNDSPTDAVLILAINDAFNDGMDVASLSVGSQALAGGADTGAACGLPAGQPCDPLAFAYEAAAKKGLVVVAAAGNSGSDAVLSFSENYPYFNSISSPSSAPSVISVGATTNSHAITPAVSASSASAPANVKSLSAQLGDSFFFPSSQGASSAPLVDVTQLGNDGLACAALPANSLKGSYALIERGTCTFETKASNAQLAGAVGIVFYMADQSPIVVPGGLGSSGAFFIGPSVMISNTDGLALKNYIDANPGQAMTIDVAGKELDLATFSQLYSLSPPLAQNQLASYSSFGPAPDGTIKPDLVATGGLDVDISPAPGMYLAAQTLDPNGILYSVSRYAAADGTSFATPLVAGAAALVKQAHPNYSAGQIKSALVNSAAQDTTTDDGASDVNGIRQSPMPVNVQWLGGGRLDAGAALKSAITSEPATVSFGYLRSNTLPVTRTLSVTNKGASPVTVAVAVAPNSAPSGSTVATDKTSLTLNANASAALNVTLSGTVPAPGSYSGAVTLSASGAVTRIPYLFLVPDGVPYNVVPAAGGLQGTPGQDAGSIAVQITDKYGVPVIGSSVSFSVSPRNGVTFQSVHGEPACSANATGGVACASDNYGVAYAEVILGVTTSTPTITVTGPPPNNIPFQFTAFILPQPAITQGQILDNAIFQPTVAPGSIAAIKGSNLMDPDLLINTAQGYDLIPSVLTSFPLVLDGVNVSFDVPGAGISVPAPVVAVSPGQIDIQVPWELKGQTSAQVKVTIDEEFGQSIYGNVVTAQLSDYTPAFFNNNNIAAALDGNYVPISNSNPAIRGQFIALYANGLGPVSNPPADGAPAGVNSITTTPCVVTIGGQTLSASQVPFCGLAPGLAIYQVNVQVPAGLTPGNQPVTISIGGKTSPASIVIPVQ